MNDLDVTLFGLIFLPNTLLFIQMAAVVQEASDVLALRGQLAHHTNWVTSIAAPSDANSPSTADLLVTGSRDKTLLKWRLTREEYQYGVPGASPAAQGREYRTTRR